MSKRSKIIAIAGPTASGKTALSIEIANKVNGEIISADSRLVYKGFDIAAAKPTMEERQGIAHYMIDIVEPEVDYSVADFYDGAKLAIQKILDKGKTPIVCGGTGLYFRILLEDFDMPRVEPDYALREELEAIDTLELYSRLQKIDSTCAEKIHPNNKVKIIRALEVCIKSGQPHSVLAGKKELEYDVEWIMPQINSREELYNRIDLRVDEMLKMGIVDETKLLLEKHGRIKNFTKTIGYKEILAYLDGEMSLEDAIEQLKINTRRYAKRQLTWFRRNKELNVNI